MRRNCGATQTLCRGLQRGPLSRQVPLRPPPRKDKRTSRRWLCDNVPYITLPLSWKQSSKIVSMQFLMLYVSKLSRSVLSTEGFCCTTTPAWSASPRSQPTSKRSHPKDLTLSGCGYTPPRFCGCTPRKSRCTFFRQRSPWCVTRYLTRHAIALRTRPMSITATAAWPRLRTQRNAMLGKTAEP